jgi:3-oxoacyl-(acyl-carrier-protein) synthase
MIAHISGAGWITPLGADLDAVWQRLIDTDPPEVRMAANPETGRLHRSIPVPPKLVDSLARNPRLRRSSAISYYAVAAGLAALENAGLKMTGEAASRTALVFAITDGGVLYTRKFYEQIVKQGARGASPLLFPETVYNAPASHFAAELGIDGATYTLVGDASVGLSALHFATQLLATSDIDQCVVVGAEESDWILCEAYQQWRFARTPLAEGAAAVVVSGQGPFTVETHPGATFFRQRDAESALESVLASFPTTKPVDLVVRSANGSFIDRAEAAALGRWTPNTPALFPKRSFGEAPGASALLQTITAILALEKQQSRRALVSVIGLNHQANAALIERLA